MRLAHVSLGGNLGDPLRQMAEALRALDAEAGHRVMAVSPAYRTPPWGMTEQPAFLNACAVVETDLAARGFLGLCLDVERRLHRRRGARWGPRTIDLDILDFGGEIHDAEDLRLPHPRMRERAFVLLPLSRIAPGLAVAGRPVSDWLSGVSCDGITLETDAAGWWRDGA